MKRHREFLDAEESQQIEKNVLEYLNTVHTLFDPFGEVPVGKISSSMKDTLSVFGKYSLLKNPDKSVYTALLYYWHQFTATHLLLGYPNQEEVLL